MLDTLSNMKPRHDPHFLSQSASYDVAELSIMPYHIPSCVCAGKEPA